MRRVTPAAPSRGIVAAYLWSFRRDPAPPARRPPCRGGPRTRVLWAGLRYLPRQDGGSGAVNGRIGQYEVYVSTDGTNWGTAVATGAFANDASQKDVRSTAKTGQYSRLRAVSEVAGNPWTSAAEIYALN